MSRSSDGYPPRHTREIIGNIQKNMNNALLMEVYTRERIVIKRKVAIATSDYQMVYHSYTK